MIKIIKEGIKPKNYKRIYNLTCNRCICEFEFEESDCFNVRREKHIDGEHKGEIACPCCEERLFIDFKTAKYREEEIIEDQFKLGGSPTIDLECLWTPSLDKCTKCGSSNTVRNDSFVLTSNPPKYSFKCKDCGHKWIGPEKAVSIDKIVFDPFDNSHCNNCEHKNKVGDFCSCCSYYPYRVTCNNEVE